MWKCTWNKEGSHSPTLQFNEGSKGGFGEDTEPTNKEVDGSSGLQGWGVRGGN